MFFKKNKKNLVSLIQVPYIRYQIIHKENVECDSSQFNQQKSPWSVVSFLEFKIRNNVSKYSTDPIKSFNTVLVLITKFENLLIFSNTFFYSGMRKIQKTISSSNKI